MSHPVLPELQGQNHQPDSTHGFTHGSRCIGSRGWPCWTSKGGEAPGPGKAQCSSVGEYQDREVGRGDWGTGQGKRAMGLSGRGDPGKGKSFEM